MGSNAYDLKVCALWAVLRLGFNHAQCKTSVIPPAKFDSVLRFL